MFTADSTPIAPRSPPPRVVQFDPQIVLGMVAAGAGLPGVADAGRTDEDAEDRGVVGHPGRAGHAATLEPGDVVILDNPFLSRGPICKASDIDQQ